MTGAELREHLSPYLPTLSDVLASQLQEYLALLLRWNRVTNLSAIREEAEIVRRHFGESLFASSLLPESASTVLDVGSGAGFPGLPIALHRPGMRVTLAEAQGKKAAFLQEAVRTLDVSNVEIWAKRTELLPATQVFDVVVSRAVDRPMAASMQVAERTAPGGMRVQLCGSAQAAPGSTVHPIPGSLSRVVAMTEPARD